MRLISLLSVILLAVISLIWLSRPRDSYLPFALTIMFAGSVPFYAHFEGRKPPARELALMAIIIALAVAGRALFMLLPQVKPMAAIVSIGAVALGPAAGFIIGSAAGLVSNFFFGQGLWTPFQMMGYGLVCVVMGLLFAPGRLPRRRWPLAITAGFLTTLIYGFIVDSSSVLLLGAGLGPQAVLGIYLAGVPFNLVHGAATTLFMAWLGPVMLKRMERIHTRYGLSRT